MSTQTGRPPLHEDYWDVCKVSVLVLTQQFAAQSFVMRHTGLSYDRTRRVLDLMEGWGIVGPAAGTIARDVLRSRDELGAVLDELHEDWERSTAWIRAAAAEGARPVGEDPR